MTDRRSFHSGNDRFSSIVTPRKPVSSATLDAGPRIKSGASGMTTIVAYMCLRNTKSVDAQDTGD